MMKDINDMRAYVVPLIGSIQDRKRHWLAASAILIFAIFGCNDVNFEKGATGADAHVPGPETLCSPIGGTVPSTSNGMFGDIYIQQPSVCKATVNYTACDSHEEMTLGTQGSRIADVVVAAPLVPTRPFDKGFETRDGGMLTYPSDFGSYSGTNVFEFWGMNLRTKIALSDLAPADADGAYQFAILADDGFKLTREDTGEVIVELKGVNSTRLVVSSKLVQFARGQRIPFKIQYYQTPRTEIAFQLLWRTRTAGQSLSESYDGQAGTGGTYWFDWTQYNSLGYSPPSAQYNDLVSNNPAHNWRPVRVQNFWMPDSTVNTCVK